MKQQAAHSHEDTLLDFAYGELPEAEARTVEAHLAGCVRCAGSLESIRGVRKTMSMLETDPAPDAGLDSLMAYAQQTARRVQAGPSGKSSRWRNWVFGLAATASLVVVGIVGTEVSKEVSPQAVIQQKATVQESSDKQAASDAQPQPEPAPAPMPAGVATGAAGSALAERATKLTPTVPSLGGTVGGKKEALAKDGAERDLARMGELARRDTAQRGRSVSPNDDQDVAQARNLGMGVGMTGNAPEEKRVSAKKPQPPQRAPKEEASAVRSEARKSDVANYYDPRVPAAPPPPVYREAEQQTAPSRLSIGKGSGSGARAPAELQDADDQALSPVASAEAFAEEEAEPSAADEGSVVGGMAGPSPQPSAGSAPTAEAPAAATPPRAAPAKKKLAGLGADAYEKRAAQARRDGDLKEEIRNLWAAAERTAPGGRQIGLLSRLCELEISAEMYQPQSCHRLVTEYPHHNAGLLAKKRLEAQAQQMQRK